jgi:hypothetical protein
MFEENVKINKNIIEEYIMYNSFIVRSNGAKYWFFKFIPKVASNQHLVKPTRPKTLATKKTISVSVGVISNKPQKI